MSNIRARIIISGLVQGVFFRKFTKENSDKLKLSGWVKNLLSGEVEIIVEGEKEKINQLIKKLEIGPENSIVKNVKIEWHESKRVQRFSIIN